MIKGNFIDNLPKVYGIYTGGFIGFIILMAIGETDGYDCKSNRNLFCGFYHCHLRTNWLAISYSSSK